MISAEHLIVLLTSLHAVQSGLVEELTGTNGYVYAFYRGGSTDCDHDEAHFKCQHENYDGLVLIKYQYNEEDVEELMDAHGEKESHIGMHDKYTEGYWYWEDGSKVADYYQDWKSGEPNDHRGEDCGTYLSPSNVWNDDDCGHAYGFICYSRPSSRTPMRNRIFMINDFENGNQGTLETAQRNCASLGYRLAVIDSHDVITKIQKSANWDGTVGYLVDGQQKCLNSDSCGSVTKYICEGVFPTTLQVSNHENDYMVGDAIEIECTGSGVPAANVTWHKHVGKLTDLPQKNAYQVEEPGKATLVIKSATLKDTARYRCVTVNEINGESRKHKAFVDIRVHPPTMTKASGLE